MPQNNNDPYAQIVTGANYSQSGPKPVNPEGVSNPPNQGQVLSETDDPYAHLAGQSTPPVDHSYSTNFMKELPGALGQAAIGALKGAGSTAKNIGRMATLHSPDAEPTGILAPTNPMQGVGRTAEQAGEFMLPGLGEEKIGKLATEIPKIGEYAAPAARVAYNGLTSGGINAAQGGGFKTGAIAGTGTGLLGEGMRAAAPGIAEKALGMRGTDRAFGKTPGRTLLDETSGVRPETVAASAKAKIGQLTPRLEQHVDAIQAPMASLAPARTVLNDAGSKAISQNSPALYGQINNMENTLHQRFNTGQTIPQDVTPRDLLNLKRGFSEEHMNWNPDRRDAALSAGRRAYGALDSELDRTVPEAAGLNQRISSLIPTARRGEAIARGEGAAPRIMERIARPTGALTGAIGGGMMGYQHGGASGAAEGAGLGLILPELMSSPTGRMIAARGFNRPVPRYVLPAIRGAALQLDRGNQ